MCRWAPPYFPGLESMAARKNGVYLADEDGGESGSECSWLRQAAVAQFSSTVTAVVPSGTPHTLHCRGFKYTFSVNMDQVNSVRCLKVVPVFARAFHWPFISVFIIVQKVIYGLKGDKKLKLDISKLYLWVTYLKCAELKLVISRQLVFKLQNIKHIRLLSLQNIFQNPVFILK